MFLLDTNVVSALGPGAHASLQSLAGWLRARSDDLYLSTVTIAEIEAGAARLRRIGAERRANLLDRWIDATVELFSARILVFDLAVARAAGSLHDQARAAGFEPGFPDVAIAATAACHGHTILTRNVKHFMPFGIPLHDPFVELPTDR